MKVIKKLNFEITKKVAFKLYYFGWLYHGSAQQATISNTVTEHFFNALKKSNLIKSDTELFQKSFEIVLCGRTDVGVSAFSQVYAVNVRAKENNFISDSELQKNDYHYGDILNAFLPKTIRVIGYCILDNPNNVEFSPRRDCKFRVYKYAIPVNKSFFNVSNVKEACSKFEGTHDFRNFAKSNESNMVTHFVRNIKSFIFEEKSEYKLFDTDYYEFTIVGSAFLWNQVRLMVAVLIMIGKGLEKPDIVAEMLNVSEMPTKPEYTMQSYLPLCLFDTMFDEKDITWISSEKGLLECFGLLENEITELSGKLIQCKRMKDSIGKMLETTAGYKSPASLMREKAEIEKKKHVYLIKRKRLKLFQTRSNQIKPDQTILK